MRIVVRAIIKDNESIIAIKRIKDREMYWVFPGGGVEDGESHEKALIRECKEELGVDIEVIQFAFEYTFHKQKEYFYYCRVVGGELGTGNGLEYDKSLESSRGLYEPMHVSLRDISPMDIRPLEIKNKIVSSYMD
jgi:mutator protein MutT